MNRDKIIKIAQETCVREPREDPTATAWVFSYDALEAFAALVVDAERESMNREWQGLTEEEINKLRHLIDWTSHWSYNHFARAIEKTLKEKKA